MKYVPKYPKEKLEELRRYVINYKNKAHGIKELKAASLVTESYRNKISKAPTDGDLRYQFFNNLLFGGKLPTSVKVYFMRSGEDKRRSTGFDSKARRESYIAMKDGPEDNCGCWFPDANSIYIFLDRVGDDDFSIDTVLVHEMCHVWQDRIYTGINNTSGHSAPFQYIKKRVQRDSRGIYDAGAVTDFEKKKERYADGWYGDPSVGKTPEQTKKYYKERIDAFSKEKRHGGWKIVDLDSKRFTYKGQDGVELYFSTSSGFKGFSAMTKTLARILNKDKEYIEGLVERFEQIKKKRGF